MNYKKLGSTNVDVSTICLGTMTWGEQNTQEEGFEQMDYALEQGVNFWDTAELYSVPPKEETFGHTEIIIGNWFKKTKQRDKVIIATKVAGPARDYIRGGGNNYTLKRMTEALNDSLKRLKTDYIDLYQLHWPERAVPVFGQLDYTHDPSDKNWTPLLEVLENLENLKKQGKIRHYGLSNETAWGIMKFLAIAEKYNLSKPISVQNGYNLIHYLLNV